MPTLQEDMDGDRTGTFLETDEFATTVTYTPTSGSPSSITVVRIEGVYAIFDNKAANLYHVSAADVSAPVRGDRITDNSEDWTVVDIQNIDGMWELRCARMQDRQ